MELARRSRGTPRIANRLLKRVRDYALVLGDGRITGELADAALDRMEIDKLGLDSNDIRILKTIIRNYGGRPRSASRRWRPQSGRRRSPSRMSASRT